jgi:outer membrane receptor protein involved in Fe transport
MPGVEVTLTNEATREVRSAVSNENGTYVFQQLAPGSYRLEASLVGFKTAGRSGIRINVTETTRLDVQLEIGGLAETITVEASPAMVQQESSALGRVVSENVVSSLPLVNRNFTQILGLSPGITVDVTHAGELGRGSGGQVTSRTSVNGARANDNSFQLDGIDSNDFQQSDGGLSNGTAVPNPDSIQEFKVQSGQADASFGRNAGAHVNIITKSGSNDIHGSLFEFFRNEAMNANDFFFNRTGQKKPIVRQNQYGGTVGGPIRRDKLFFFGSYQGTRQYNGLAAGKARAVCNSTISSPALTDDRSAAALGALFAGRGGQNGGVTVKTDGSNINPIALRLLNMKNPDGSFLFPTPQVIDRTQPFARQGFSAFSVPCSFDENQYMANFDYLRNEKSKFAVRYILAKSVSNVSFASASSVPGVPTLVYTTPTVGSLAHSYVFNPRVFNELRVGFFLSPLRTPFVEPAFTLSSIGIKAPINTVDIRPGIAITGSYGLTYANSRNQPQRTFAGEDHLSYVRGVQNLRFGGGITRIQDDVIDAFAAGTLTFQSFPDFLLGLSAADNGTAFSNVFSSGYNIMPNDTQLRLWDGFAYVQDDVKLKSRLTLNLGLRYERLSHAGDRQGDDSNFELRTANPNPPPQGTYEGFVVAKDYNYLSPARQDPPAGVVRLNTKSVLDGKGQNTFASRIGLSWQILPNSSRILLRAGYGWYYTRSVGLIYNYMGNTARTNYSRTGTFNAVATFQNPYQPPPPAYTTDRHSWIWTDPPYSPTTTNNVTMLAPDFRHALTQQYSLNIQTEFARNFLLEVGYVGARATHLNRGVSPNQALLASPSNPIRGVTTNTVGNVAQRVRIQGFQPGGMSYVDSNGSSWYNSMQTSITKRMSHGLQFLTSYTWSKNLGTEGAKDFRGARGGTTPGDQIDARQRYGPSELSRAHRFVFSYIYEFPNTAKQNTLIGKLAAGWSVSGVATFQTGSPLSILLTSGNNVYGITNDRAQLAAGCTHADLVTSGQVQQKLNNYFNAKCFTTPPVIGDDARATAFGNSGVGIVNGPAQQNIDMSIIKKIPLPSERTRMEFRAEFFNLFNTPQFADPATNLSSSTFGQISSTSVNPRFVQLALKLSF